MSFNPLIQSGIQADPKLKIYEQSSDFTLDYSTNYSFIKATSSTPILVTLPNNLFAGFQCFIVQGGAGVVQYTTGNGATLNSVNGHQKLSGQNAVLHLAVFSNPDGNSAEWHVLKADSIEGAIAALPPNFTEIFGHHFFVDANLIISSGTTVTDVINGTGVNAFSLDNTPPLGGQTYSGTKLTRPSGITALLGGALNQTGVVDLSQYSDFTQIFLAYHTYSGTTLSSLTVIAQFYNTNGTDGGSMVNGWSTQQGVGIQGGGWNVTARNCVEDKNVHLIIYTRTAGILDIYVDGVLCFSGSNSVALNASGIVYNSRLAPNGNSTAAGTMAILDSCFYGRGVNSSEIAQIDEFYKATFPNDYKSNSLINTNLWIYNSNSIGAGFSYGNPNTPSAKTFGFLKDTYSKNIDRWYNISKGGITTQQMSTEAPVYVDPFWGECTGQSNLILHEGTNDIYLNNITGAQAYANLRDYWQSRKLAGCDRVFVGTILPRTAMNGTQNTARLECNALIRSSAVADGCTAIIDFDNDFNPSVANANLYDPTNTTYYSDGTHPKLLGAEQMGITIASVLNAYV